jgi:hypothetical protein
MIILDAIKYMNMIVAAKRLFRKIKDARIAAKTASTMIQGSRKIPKEESGIFTSNPKTPTRAVSPAEIAAAYPPVRIACAQESLSEIWK